MGDGTSAPLTKRTGSEMSMTQVPCRIQNTLKRQHWSRRSSNRASSPIFITRKKRKADRRIPHTNTSAVARICAASGSKAAACV